MLSLLLSLLLPVVLSSPIADTGNKVWNIEDNESVNFLGDSIVGDIAYTTDDLYNRKGFKDRLWPKTGDKYVINYIYTDTEPVNAEGKQGIKDAMAAITAAAGCIEFKEGSTNGPHLVFGSHGGCWSYVGHVFGGYPQPVSIGDGCHELSTTEHEIMHALGIVHEQCRPDRDEYVTIMWDNVSGGKSNNNFDIETGSDTMGLPYDYLSVMHYYQHAFTTDWSKPTIVAKDPAFQERLGSAPDLTETDKLTIKKLYGC